MTHMPMDFYLLLGAALSWVGLLAFLGLRRTGSTATASHDLGRLKAIEAFLAELMAQAGELRLPTELERDAAEFQDLVADVFQGGAALSAQEAQDLSDFLHDLTLALPYLPEGSPLPDLAQDGVEGLPDGIQAAVRFREHVGLTVLASALATSMDEAIHDGRYVMALSSHEPSFSPGAPISPFDVGGPAHMGV